MNQPIRCEIQDAEHPNHIEDFIAFPWWSTQEFMQYITSFISTHFHINNFELTPHINSSPNIYLHQLGQRRILHFFVNRC